MRRKRHSENLSVAGPKGKFVGNTFVFLRVRNFSATTARGEHQLTTWRPIISVLVEGGIAFSGLERVTS
jgi:hypothetical protein